MGSPVTKNRPLGLFWQDLTGVRFFKVGCGRAGTMIGMSVRQGEMGEERREGQKLWRLRT